MKEKIDGVGAQADPRPVCAVRREVNRHTAERVSAAHDAARQAIDRGLAALAEAKYADSPRMAYQKARLHFDAAQISVQHMVNACAGAAEAIAYEERREVAR